MPQNPRTIPTPAPRDRPSYTIKIDGEALDRAVQVLSVRVQKEVNRVPTAHLIIKDGDAAAGEFALSSSDTFTPGKKVEISAGFHGQEKVIFKGLLVKHAITVRSSGTTRLSLMCKDEFVKLTLAPKSRYFTNMKDSEVAEQIVQGYSGLQIEAAATAVEHEELLQYDATDWDYIMLRAEANGQLCLVDDGKLNITKPDFSQDPVLELQFGATVLDLDAGIDARDQVATVKASTWDYTELSISETDASEPSLTEHGNLSAESIAEAFNTDVLIQHGGKLEQGELQAWADAALLKHRMAKVRGRVRFYGHADVKPGTMLGLGGLGDKFNGKAFVSGVSHLLEEGSWLTDVQFGLSPLPFAAEVNVSKPAAAGLLPPLQGLQLGVVTALEGDTSGEERIQVRLPVVDAAAEGAFARVMSLDAGKERGFYFRPEIGDEVVIGFLNNDPREAIVLGGLHGSQHNLPPPFVTKDDNHLKGYVSRSQLKLLFDDEKKIITLETPAGNQFILDDDATSITLQDQNGNKLVMSDQGISLESSKDLILKASGDIKLDGMNIEQKASAQFTATGSAGVELSSTATAVLKGSLVQIN